MGQMSPTYSAVIKYCYCGATLHPGHLSLRWYDSLGKCVCMSIDTRHRTPYFDMGHFCSYAKLSLVLLFDL